jgi:hypothetical protein
VQSGTARLDLVWKVGVMGSATLHMWSADEATRERDALLAEVGHTWEQLERHAEADALDEREYQVWRRLQSLGWLLGAE